MPVPREVLGYALNATPGTPEDYTYGTQGIQPFNNGAGTPVNVLALDGTGTALPVQQQRNNSELMAILMDIDNFSGALTRNTNHVMNTQKTKYLNARMSDSIKAAGVGPDGVYRDPWKNPYIITIDANSDDKARDAFYRLQVVAGDPSDSTIPPRGLNGLLPAKPNGNLLQQNGNAVYEVNQQAAAWSAGPDGFVDPAIPGNRGVNKDNVLSWAP
jgi:hypothetical protein